MAKYDNWYKQVRVLVVFFCFFLKKWQCETLKAVTGNNQKGVQEGNVQYNLDNLSSCLYL